jgi:hypothetical protein
MPAVEMRIPQVRAMKLSGLVVVAVVVGLAGEARPACAAGPGAQTPAYSEHTTGVRGLPGGTIVAFVRDASGRPVADAVVTAVGKRIATGVTDKTGRCDLSSLPAGDYLVRVHHAGYLAARSLLVLGTPGVGTTWSFQLKPQPATFMEPVDDDPRPLYTAGFVGDEPVMRPAPTPASGGDDDHGEVAWRVRHLKRSVLQDATEQVIAGEQSNGDFDQAAADAFARHREMDAVARFATGLLSDSLVGQVNLLTSSTFDSPMQLISANTLARGVAQVSLGSSAGRHGDWSVQGAMSQGDVAGWMVSGSYVTHMPARHAYSTGMSYSLQRYDGTNPAALSSTADGNRYAAVLYAFDAWTITERVSLTYGGEYAKYGYIENSLFSPRARLTVAPTRTLRVSVGAGQHSIAPGAEEFSPSMVAGRWLPPERTFAPIPGAAFVPERTVSYDVAADQDLSPTTVIGVRTFRQDTDDQMVTLFGLGTVDRPTADLGHYYVGSVGDVAARGWTVSLRQVIGERVHGSVDYTVTTAEWKPTSESDMVSLQLPGLVRQGSERVQDVTAAIDTLVPVTETHIVALYRISSGYTGATVAALGPMVAARFDVQVSQSLPFMDFSNAHWEMLVGVRNLFHEMSEDASVYDELMVTRPPKRIVGGLTLRF